MIKWWRERSTPERWMVALIAMLLLGIAVRWAWISQEAAGAFRDRFSPTGQTAPAAPTGKIDSLPQ